ncbi:MAG: nicotinate-nucleotide--dimethylbenzimidazole phosphoribosyltransferase [Gammaproteobacteria bacterium]
MTAFAWLQVRAQRVDAARADAATARQRHLTKPPGSLGRLEEIAIRLAGLQGVSHPALERVRVAVFAADHGVVAEGVSAFPQSVTMEMLRNFARGGAAINVLVRAIGATLEVINLGTVTDAGALPDVLDRRIAPGTDNFCHGPAMNDAQLAAALTAGREAAERAHGARAQLFIGGEMGIGNTTAASAIACAVLGLPPAQLVGPGTGLDPQGVKRKVSVVEKALAQHRSALDAGPVVALRCLGGFEIAALTGAFARSAQLGIPVLVDGFIASVAALVAARATPDAGAWFFYAHESAEPGHAHVLRALEAEPLLRLGMRLGEGSGAAVAVPLLRLACALHNDMATFAEAGVSGGEA